MNNNVIAVSQQILNIFYKLTPEIFLQRYRLLNDGGFMPAVNMMVFLGYFLHSLILTSNGHW